MVAIVFEGLKAKSIQQENKIKGTVFEHYVNIILGEFFSWIGDRIVFHKKVPDIIEEAGFKASKTYVLLVDTLPFVYRYKDLDVLDFLYKKVRIGKSIWGKVLREGKYKHLEIVRLDRYRRVPDFIVLTANNRVVIVDCKYRSHKYTITIGDIQRLMVYYEILKRGLRNKDVGKPILLFNIANQKHLKNIYLGIEKGLGGKGIRVNFSRIFLENYVGEEEEAEENWGLGDYEFEIPPYIIRKEEIRKMIGKLFHITFIEWYLHVLGLPIDDVIKVVAVDNRTYVAFSKALGEHKPFYKGKLGKEFVLRIHW